MTHGILEDHKSDGKIYADVSQPATLIDGDNSIDCPTLGEAVILWTICQPIGRAPQ